MKQNIKLETIASVRKLDSQELATIDGGRGFWGDVFYAIGATAHFVGYMFADAYNHPIRPSEYR